MWQTLFKPITALLVGLCTLAGCSSSSENYQAWLDDGGIVLDTRTLAEYQADHVGISVLMPYDEVPARIHTVAPDKNTPILLYCRSGRRAGVAEKALLDMGYTRVQNLGSLAQARSALGVQ